MTEIIIDKRFCGPRASANGGYAAGMFAQVIDGPAEITLKSPPPLGEKITLRADGDGAFEAVHGETVLASMRPGSAAVDLPPLPDDAALATARDDYLRDEAMTIIYPYCFVCGKRREAHDGLHIFAGSAPGSAINADRWTPREDLAGDDGLVRPEYLWAALDCPGAFALRLDGAFVLLGRFTANIRRRPAAGEQLIVAAWKTGAEGRKHFSSSALFDENREIIAAANAVWIEISDPALLRRLTEENA